MPSENDPISVRLKWERRVDPENGDSCMEAPSIRLKGQRWGFQEAADGVWHSYHTSKLQRYDTAAGPFDTWDEASKAVIEVERTIAEAVAAGVPVHDTRQDGEPGDVLSAQEDAKRNERPVVLLRSTRCMIARVMGKELGQVIDRINLGAKESHQQHATTLRNEAARVRQWADQAEQVASELEEA